MISVTFDIFCVQCTIMSQNLKFKNETA